MSELRERILAAAREQFHRFGLAKTTMREIASQVGVAVGTLYRYFDGKDALIAAFIEEFQSHHRQVAQAILASAEPAELRLRQYLQGRFEASARTRGSPHAAEIERAVLRIDPGRLQAEAEEMEATLAQLLSEGREEGVFALEDPARAARFLVYAVGWFFPLASAQLPRWPTGEELAFVLDWFLAQIAA